MGADRFHLEKCKCVLLHIFKNLERSGHSTHVLRKNAQLHWRGCKAKFKPQSQWVCLLLFWLRRWLLLAPPAVTRHGVLVALGLRMSPLVPRLAGTLVLGLHLTSSRFMVLWLWREGEHIWIWVRWEQPLPHEVLQMNQEGWVISQGRWVGFVVG